MTPSQRAELASAADYVLHKYSTATDNGVFVEHNHSTRLARGVLSLLASNTKLAALVVRACDLAASVLDGGDIVNRNHVYRDMFASIKAEAEIGGGK